MPLSAAAAAMFAAQTERNAELDRRLPEIAAAAAAVHQAGGAFTAHDAFEQAIASDALKNVAADVIPEDIREGHDFPAWFVAVAPPPPEAYTTQRYNYRDPHGRVIAKKGGIGLDELLSAFRQFKPNDGSRTVAMRMSSADGKQGARNAGGGGEAAVAAHEEKRRARVIQDPALLFKAVLGTLEASKARVGPIAFVVLAAVLRRVELVVRPGIEFEVSQTPGELPAWILKSREHDKWRWLSHKRAYKGFDVGLLEKIFGLMLTAATLTNAAKSLARREFASRDTVVTMKPRDAHGQGYVGSELVGVQGVVLALDIIPPRTNRRVVRWDLNGGALEEPVPMTLLMEVEGGRVYDVGQNSRLKCCDKCRTKLNGCRGGNCQDARAPVSDRSSRTRKQPVKDDLGAGSTHMEIKRRRK